LATQSIQSVYRLDSIVNRTVASLRNTVIDVALSSREHMNVLLSAYVHRRDKMRWQLMFVFDDINGSRIYRFLVILVHINTKRLRRERVHVSARAQRISANVGPREIRLDARRR